MTRNVFIHQQARIITNRSAIIKQLDFVEWLDAVKLIAIADSSGLERQPLAILVLFVSTLNVVISTLVIIEVEWLLFKVLVIVRFLGVLC
jgi:hypothetical protein